MAKVREKKEKQTASVNITVTSLEEKDRIIKHSIWFGGVRYMADNFVEISQDTLCLTFCH